MIQRIVLFKLKEDFANDEARAQIAERTLTMLTGLPMVTGARVGVPADPESLKSWDLSLVVEFNAYEDVEAYHVDPVHKAHVQDYMLPRAEVRKAWNFRVG